MDGGGLEETDRQARRQTGMLRGGWMGVFRQKIDLYPSFHRAAVGGAWRDVAVTSLGVGGGGGVAKVGWRVRLTHNTPLPILASHHVHKF